MNNQTIYWLWIQETIGYASVKITDIIEKFTFPEDFYRSSLEEKLACGCFSTQKDINKLKNLSLENAQKTMSFCKEHNIEIVTIGDSDYPYWLTNIAGPPAVLFVKGNAQILSEEHIIGMVGTRQASPYGRRVAFNLGSDLARNDYTIVSGGAVGIDSCSHMGALQADGKTVCVLGCGLEYRYLRENDEMKRRILSKGAIISEYLPYTTPTKFTFPQRNRIISGLSKGVLIVEAGKKSGSLITASLALEQGRDVFAVPGDVSSNVSFGTNALIKDGAVPVTCADDIIEYYGGTVKKKSPSKSIQPKVNPSNQYNQSKENQKKRIEKVPSNPLDILAFILDQVQQDGEITEQSKPPKSSNAYGKKSKAPEKNNIISEQSNISKPDNAIKKRKISKEELAELSDEARLILSLFKEEKIHIDQLALLSKLPTNDVLAAVTELEMFEYIEMLQGNFYKACVIL
ncbi:MAG: DNA-processing protein DprA [Clostridia bacterium]|nr:DNA-processing protein DprA [Clostridia bacterium]